jgi:integrase
MDALITEFLASRIDTCQENSRATYRAYLGAYARWAVDQEGEPLAPATIRAYIAACRTADRNATLCNRARYLRMLCNWAREEGKIDASPFEGRGRVRMPTAKRPRRTVWSQADIVALLRAAEPTQWKRGERRTTRQQWTADGPMEREAQQGIALVCLLVDSALRAAEAAGLSCGQVRAPRLLIKGKGGHWDVAYVSQATRAELRTLAGDRPDDAPLFRDYNNRRCTTRGIRGIVQRLARRAGVQLPERPVHAFRHFAARQWLKAGVPDLTIRQFMRHESLATTQIYTELDPDELEELHAGASPISALMTKAGIAVAA